MPAQKVLSRIQGHKNLSLEAAEKELRTDAKGQIFFRIIRPGRSVNKPAGSIGPDGYRRVSLFGQKYLAHRLVFLLTHKRWPKEQLDHINGCRDDNRPVNLREVTIAQNRKNVTRTSATSSGVVGVTWAVKEGNWRASISVKGKGINLGHFHYLDQAIAARKTAEEKYGYLIE